jgi:hypothetical protein
MLETKTRTQILPGNFERPKTLRKMQQWFGYTHSRLYSYLFPVELPNLKDPMDDFFEHEHQGWAPNPPDRIPENQTIKTDNKNDKKV